MVQKEVAERLAAAPGTPDYGALTASVAYYGQAERLLSVSAGCFYPEPDVDSAVVQLVPRPSLSAPRAAYVRAVRALFAQRRKTVLNNLRREYALGAEAAQDLLTRAGIDPRARAETLSPQDFSRLALLLA